MEKGKLIVFEGPNKSGKSTQIDLVEKVFQERRLPFHLYREPGGSPAGELMREILLVRKDIPLTHKTRAFGFMFSRAQLMESTAIPLLESGEHIILDRYFYSTTAFQGAGGELGQEYVDTLAVMAGCIPPDRVYLLNFSFEDYQRRLHADNGTHPERFELEPDAFTRRVLKCYHDLPMMYPDVSFLCIDATKSREEIHAVIVKDLHDHDIL